MDGTATLYLVRHAEQASEAGDPGLSAAGRVQAVRLGQRFADVGVDTVHHSPQRRAAETAQLLAAEVPGVEVVGSDLLRDVTPVPGPQEELSYPDWLRRRLLDVPAAERDVDGEGLRRAVEHFGRVQDGEQRQLLLVTHAFVVGWFVRHALDAPSWRWAGLQPAHASVTVVQFTQSRPPALLAFNDVAHLS